MTVKVYRAIWACLERKWTVDDAKIQHDKMRKFYFIYNNLQDEIKAA